MRRRQGMAAGPRGSSPESPPGDGGDSTDKVERRKPGEGDGEKGSGVDARERVFSWFDVIRSGAQLTLDIMRVIREASDLYKKLSG